MPIREAVGLGAGGWGEGGAGALVLPVVKKLVACPSGSVIWEAVKLGRAGLSCRSNAVY